MTPVIRSGELQSTGWICLLEIAAASFLLSFGVMLALGSAAGWLCLAATFALIAAMLPIVLRGRVEKFEPIWFVLLNVGIGVTAKAFYICLGPQERIDFLLLGMEPADLIPAALVIVVGISFFSVGYLVGDITWKMPGAAWLGAESWRRSRFKVLTGLLVMIGVVSSVAFASSVDASFEQFSDLSSKRFVELEDSLYRGSQGYLRWGVLQLELGFYLVFVHWARSGRKLLSSSGAMVIALGLLALVFPLFTSSRWTILVLLIRMAVIWACIGRRFRFRYLVTLLVLGVVLMGSMLAFRRGQSQWADVREHVGVSELLAVSVGGRHFLDLSKTAHVIAAIPGEVRFQHGKTLVAWLVTPIPRSVWPGKPSIRPGGFLGPIVFGQGKASGVPPGIVGDLYSNFGVAGVLAGLLVIGILLRSLHSTLRPHFPNPGVVLMYTFLVTRFGLELFGTSVSGTMAKLLQELVPLLFCLFLLKPRDGAASSPLRVEP